jgi:lipid II:glycine glycyltransferase (peptidoglycan interpeptide bridge formation enzyme)
MHSSTPQPVRVTPEELPPADTFLQTPFWAEVKRSFGWQPLAFRLDRQPLLVLLRRFSPGFFLAYVPHGLGGIEPALRKEQLTRIQSALREHVPGGTVAVRYDLPWEREADFEEQHFATEMGSAGLNGFRRAAADIQPPSTVLVPLEGSEDEVLARMKRKTRYNIRLAGKRGVTTAVTAEPDLERWYRLYRETAERDRIAIHSFEYYRRLFSLAAETSGAPQLYMVEAYHQGEYLAGNIVALYRGTATYMYGASANSKRNLMPTYAVQWGDIALAREHGCTVYDLFGIPPARDPGHPMHGLYRFKTGFGGRIVHRYGAWDAPLHGALYGAFRWAERLRTYYYKTLKKR